MYFLVRVIWGGRCFIAIGFHLCFRIHHLGCPIKSGRINKSRLHAQRKEIQFWEFLVPCSSLQHCLKTEMPSTEIPEDEGYCSSETLIPTSTLHIVITPRTLGTFKGTLIKGVKRTVVMWVQFGAFKKSL
jgi:hypothetical protein